MTMPERFMGSHCERVAQGQETSFPHMISQSLDLKPTENLWDMVEKVTLFHHHEIIGTKYSVTGWRKKKSLGIAEVY